jgi:hypothetical protein
MMKNIILAIDEEILERGEEYAKRHHTSLTGLVQDLLEQTVKPRTELLEEMFRLMDEAKGNSEGETWTREEIHERSFGREPQPAPNE